MERKIRFELVAINAAFYFAQELYKTLGGMKMFKKIGGRFVGVPLLAPDSGGGAGVGAAGGGGNDPGAGQVGGQGDPPAGTELPKSQEELQTLLQSETDKKIAEALKTAQAQWEQDFKTKLDAEKVEAEKLAKMSASEKEQALLDKQKKDIEDRELSIQQRELKIETIKILNEKKLPIDFAELLLASDAEKTKLNVDTFEKAFRESVQTAVEERLKGSTPGGGSASGAINYGKKAAEALTQNSEALEKARGHYFN